VGRHAVAIVKAVDAEEDAGMIEEYAKAIKDTFLTETGNKCIIGISEPRESIAALHEAYDEARHAINVGRVYHPEREIFLYSGLLLERFLDEVSGDIGASYNAKIFNRKTARLFNEEMLTTIVTFFDNSLNLSETARKLYIHRNTLVYRLEKVQKEIGIDLRNFDDAVTFKLLLLLGKNSPNRKNKV
jgi:Sugar diacid utilization regulator